MASSTDNKLSLKVYISFIIAEQAQMKLEEVNIEAI